MPVVHGFSAGALGEMLGEHDFPTEQQGKVDELAFKKLKAPCDARWLRAPAGFLLQKIGFIFP